MAGRQGFISNGVTFIYQESPGLPSAAIGIDSNDNHIWKIKCSQTDNALPTGTAHLAIDSRTDGNITLTPNGTGKLVLAYSGAGALVSSSSGEISSSGAGTSGQVMTSNGAGVAPTFQAISNPIWTAVAGNTVSLAASNNYMLDNAALTTATLPATCAAGATIRISGSGAGLFLIAQNAGQSIKLGLS